MVKKLEGNKSGCCNKRSILNELKIRNVKGLQVLFGIFYYPQCAEPPR